MNRYHFTLVLLASVAVAVYAAGVPAPSTPRIMIDSAGTLMDSSNPAPVYLPNGLTLSNGSAATPSFQIASQSGVVAPSFDGYIAVGSAAAVLFSTIVGPGSYTVPCIVRVAATQDVYSAASGTATASMQWLHRQVADSVETYKLVATTTFARQYICGTYTATLSVSVYPIR